MTTHAAPGPVELVDALAVSEERFPAFVALVALGAEALPAIRDGLASPNWQVRRWCAMCLDRVADADSLLALVPLLRDPQSGVRLWAVHALACDHCKEDVECPVDVVPLLIERIEIDKSLRVRRMAMIMLGTEFIDPRAVPVFRQLLRAEEDCKLRLHAEAGLRRLRDAGVADDAS